MGNTHTHAHARPDTSLSGGVVADRRSLLGSPAWEWGAQEAISGSEPRQIKPFGWWGGGGGGGGEIPAASTLLYPSSRRREPPELHTDGPPEVDEEEERGAGGRGGGGDYIGERG